MNDAHFETNFRVYYEDTDAGGVVYHSNYLNFMERARTDFLRHSGFEQNPNQQPDFLFVVQKLNIHYYAPLILDDLFTVTVSVTRLTKTRVVFEQKIIKYGQDRPATVAEVVICAISTNKKKPVAIPSDIYDVFNRNCM